MATLDSILAALGGPLAMEKLQKAQAGGTGITDTTPTGEPAKAKTIEELLGKFIAAPIPIGTEFAKGYAPGGPQLNFTGGSPFPVDDTPAAMHNGAFVLSQLAEVLGELRKKKAKAAATPKPGDVNV